MVDFQVTWTGFAPHNFIQVYTCFLGGQSSDHLIPPWPQVVFDCVFNLNIHGVILYVSSCNFLFKFPSTLCLWNLSQIDNMHKFSLLVGVFLCEYHSLFMYFPHKGNLGCVKTGSITNNMHWAFLYIYVCLSISLGWFSWSEDFFFSFIFPFSPGLEVI